MAEQHQRDAELVRELHEMVPNCAGWARILKDDLVLALGAGLP